MAASFIPQTLKLEEPLEIYDDIQNKFINYDEKYKTKFNAADNLVASTAFNCVIFLFFYR